MEGLGFWPLKICRRGQSMFWPPKIKASIVALNRRSILGLIFRTLLRDLARFNVSNCNVVANNRVYLLSYSMELFVVLQQCRLHVQSNAGDQRAPPYTGSPVRVPAPDRLPWVATTRGERRGGRETSRYWRETRPPAHGLPVTPPHTHTPPRSSHIALSICPIGGDNVALTLAGSRGQWVGM